MAIRQWNSDFELTCRAGILVHSRMENLLTAATSHLLAPSFLAADFLHIAEEVKWLEHPEVDLIHLDVMDGQFVPNISFGMPIIKAIDSLSTKPLDVHLMIERPEQYIQTFRDVGADIITVHYEACTHLHRTVQQIKETGALAGIALNPHTPVSLLHDIIQDADMVCLMSVNPGFGGQKFIPRTLDKIRELKAMIDANQSACRIEIDGGVGPANAAEIVSAGADVLVAGSAVFKSADRNAVVQQMKNI